MMKQHLDALLADIKREFPEFTMKRKADSTLMSSIHVFLQIVTLGNMTEFMTSYSTTIGVTIYTASDWETLEDAKRAALLRHERVHMRQVRRIGRLPYTVMYLVLWFPVVFAWYRAQFEMEAYAETIQANYDYGMDITTPQYKAKMVGRFLSADYGWMWPFRGTIEKWFDRTVQEVLMRDVTVIRRQVS